MGLRCSSERNKRGHGGERIASDNLNFACSSHRATAAIVSSRRQDPHIEPVLSFYYIAHICAITVISWQIRNKARMSAAPPLG